MSRLNDFLGSFFSPLNIRKRFPKYIFNRPLFYIYMALVTMVVLVLLQTYGYEQQTYFKCSSGFCETPNGDTVSAPYEEGIRAPDYVKNFGWYALLALVVFFLFNHIGFNPKKRKKDNFIGGYTK